MMVYFPVTTLINGRTLTAYIPNKKEQRPVCYTQECVALQTPNENGERYKILKKGWFVNIHKGNWQKIKGSTIAREHKDFQPENIKILGCFDFQVEEIFKESW
jgi:hypothetical protein